jgi:hypothetical protein
MTVLQEWLTAQDSPEVVVNENFDTLGAFAVYGYNPATSSGLTWGYYGGRWGGFAVAAGTLALTDASTNYIVVLRSTGVISVSTSITNWNDTTTYARVYRVVTAGGVVTNLYGTDFDYRAGDGGIFGSSAGGGGASLSADNTWTGAQRGAITTDNDLSFDLDAGNNFSCAPTGAGTLTFTNIASGAGQSGLIKLVNGSNYAISAAATTKVDTSFLTTISATGTYLVTYFSDGTNVFCVTSGDLS